MDSEENRADIEAHIRGLETEVSQLRSALHTRIVVEQAKGAISVAAGVTIDEAFALLRRHARNEGRDIHFVAAEAIRNYGRLDRATPGYR